jgi:hypothetical protein
MNLANRQNGLLRRLVAVGYALCALGLPAVWHQSLDHDAPSQRDLACTQSHTEGPPSSSDDHKGDSSQENCSICAHIAFSKVQATTAGAEGVVGESLPPQVVYQHQLITQNVSFGAPSSRAPPLL